ncbi:MAG: outer membrane protein transport protein [Sulfurimonas sp.]|nr:outer membrane protein transport protein [Sulfurimonas sp.]
MKKTIKLAVVAALALGTTSAFATNGSNLIGMGAKARGMGGVGIGMSHGAESGLSNGALITSVEGTEISFGGTFFMPKVKADMGAGFSESAADLSVIPEVSIASKITDNFYMGVGMWGTAGMGVDYRDETGYTANMNMVTNLQLMQFGVPLAYKTNGLSIAVTPLLQDGALDINYKDPSNTQAGYTGTGAGVSQDLKFGYNLGAAYEISGFTVGAMYKSKIDMEYKGQLSSATQPFVAGGVFPSAMDDKLSTPAEMGVGVSYNMEGHTIAADYKKISWSSAKGYEDFNWEDQNVLALGYQYDAKDWAVRIGYNYASNPISDAGAITLAEFMTADGTNPQMFGGNAINTFNLLGFPATVESHITVGGTYKLSKSASVDLAYAYAPETTTTLATMPDMTNGVDGETTVKHSQSSVSAQVNFKF